MMKYIILEPEQLERLDSDIIRRCMIKKMDDGLQVDQQQLWFQFSDKINPPDDNDCDSYLLALLMDAMSEERKIIVKGSVSKQLLSNLVEYQTAWNKWLPDVYKIIDIEVEFIKENEVSIPGAICAFSGGVDGAFSVWRHTQKKNSYRSMTINLCSFVHGFDIPLSDNHAFDNYTKKSVETLRDLNLPLIPIKTNYREISTVNWEHSHSCALIAALSNFKRIAGNCIVGSTHAYNALVIPWGSSPITDHLLGSGEFEVIHDGSSHNRTEKVNDISDWIAGVNNLHVCWQGDLKDSNCGKCEKCLRTQCNFLAIGRKIPNCFPQLDGEEINVEGVVLNKKGLRIQWEQILEYATINHIEQPWVFQLSKLVNEKTLVDILFPKGSLQRKIVGKLNRLI